MMSSTDKCNLVLYYRDKRISKTEWSDRTELSLSKQTAKSAKGAISGYFQLENTWDKKLFESAFSSEIDLNWFEFKKKNSPNITYGIKILSNKNIVSVDNPEAVEALDKGGRKVRVIVRNFFGVNEYHLSLKDLRGDIKNDLSIVALYNSESFIKHTQCNSNMSVARFLEVIEPQKL